MNIKVVIYPDHPSLRNRLQKTGVEVTGGKCQVLHYFGKSTSELKGLLAKHTPDLLVTHEIAFFSRLEQFQVYHPYSNSDFKTKSVVTNSLPLAKHYYQAIGMQVQFIEFKQPVKRRLKLNLSGLYSRFKTAMAWE